MTSYSEIALVIFPIITNSDYIAIIVSKISRSLEYPLQGLFIRLVFICQWLILLLLQGNHGIADKLDFLVLTIIKSAQFFLILIMAWTTLCGLKSTLMAMYLLRHWPLITNLRWEYQENNSKSDIFEQGGNWWCDNCLSSCNYLGTLEIHSKDVRLPCQSCYRQMDSSQKLSFEQKKQDWLWHNRCRTFYVPPWCL